MAEYNAPLFGAYATVFLVYRKIHGEEKALEFMSRLPPIILGPAYDKMGFQRGNTKDAARVIGERDASVGLNVAFPVIEPHRLVYEFHTDPFPMLIKEVDPRVFDRWYMVFKVEYLLGDNWDYETPEHIWDNGEITRHVITRRR